MTENIFNTVDKGTIPTTKPSENDSRLLFFNYHETCTENYALLGHKDDIHETSLVITHFPNYYISQDSKDYTQTRIVRIPRCFTTPALPYPEFITVLPGKEEGAIIDNDQTFVIKGIVDGQWFGMNSFSPLSLYLSDSEFNEIVDQMNQLLRKSYETSFWDVIWTFLDMLCLWLLSQVIKPIDKRRLDELEDFVQEQNKKLESKGIKIISPRRSAYLSLDFQIPRPQPG